MSKEEKLIQERLYDYAAGGYCGVLMPDHVMKKLAKLNHKYSTEVRRVLEDNKSDLYVSDWTLANKMNGDDIEKQVTIRYTTEDREGINQRIRLFKASEPKYVSECYIVNDHDEAKKIAEEVLLEELEKL